MRQVAPLLRAGLSAALMLAAVSPAFAEKVIVKCNMRCDAAVAAIEQDGGRVTHRYKYVTAIAADVVDATLPRLRALLGPGAVRKDVIVSAIGPTVGPRGNALAVADDAASWSMLDAQTIGSPEVAPAAYTVNNLFTDVQPLHDAGFFGGGVTVAVLDSGIRPGFPHIAGSVIGGEDFIGDGRGFSNFTNNGHGTFVAGMIAAHINLTFNPASTFFQGIAAGCPACVVGTSTVPMIGTAPLASIYAVRVLGVGGSGPTSGVLAAMERVIDLRRAYDAGESETQNPDGSYNALNIRVANMSLGGSTIFAGQDISDQLTNAFLDNDIVLVVAAGNAGPSGSTIGSPGSGYAALTVGAASTAIHEGVLRRAQFGPAIGALYRPFPGTQTAFFSSRGPNADGRPDPDIVANGFGSFGMGLGATTSTVSIASGTSFATPTISGIAAVLRQAEPLATARQVRNALIATANPNVIADGSGPLDRGTGFVDAAAARALLHGGQVPDTNPGVGVNNTNVNVNFLQGAGVQTFSDDVTRSVSNLLPGERFETFYRVSPNTAAVVVTLSGVTPGAVQNALFGDDILFGVHSAKTSSIGEGDYVVPLTVTTGGTFVIPQPDLGIMRITVSGDWTNASPIGATISITPVIDPEPGITAQAKIGDGDEHVIPFTVPVGAKMLSVRAEWEGDWGSYPTNDLDVILVRPDGTMALDAATLNDPERAEIEDPAPGQWMAVVEGFTVATKNGDQYKLRIAVDGQVIR